MKRKIVGNGEILMTSSINIAADKTMINRKKYMRTFSIPLNFRHNYGLVRSSRVKVPKEIQVPIFLIRHELQNRMFYKHLQEIGLEGCYFESFLDRLILASLRMWDGTDATFKIYFDLMEKWSKDINADEDVITRRA